MVKERHMAGYGRDICFYTTTPEAGRRLDFIDHEICPFDELPKPRPKSLDLEDVPATVS